MEIQEIVSYLQNTDFRTLAFMAAGFYWFNKLIDKKFDKFEEKMNHRFEMIDRRFEMIDRRFEMIDRRFEMIDQRLDKMDQRLDRLEEKVTDIDRRVCRMEGSMASKDFCVLKDDRVNKRIE